ncbi:hypothetical protein SLA2020_467420 [Shorea laevis]
MPLVPDNMAYAKSDMTACRRRFWMQGRHCACWYNSSELHYGYPEMFLDSLSSYIALVMQEMLDKQQQPCSNMGLESGQGNALSILQGEPTSKEKHLSIAKLSNCIEGKH